MVGSSVSESSSSMDIAVSMSMILGTLVAIIGGLILIQTPLKSKDDDYSSTGYFLTSSSLEPSKRACKCLLLGYFVR